MNSVSIQYFIARPKPPDQRAQCACFSKLIGLAELKLHIQDKYLRQDKKAEVHKRSFGLAKAKDKPEDGDSVMITAAPIQVGVDDQEASTLDDSGDGSANRRGWNQLTRRLQDLAQDEPQENSTPTFCPGGSHSVPLREQFDLSDIFWLDVHARTGKRTMRDEEELYESMDTEAQGEGVLDFDVEEHAEAILGL